jgi:alanyl-tRNA synthetase
MDLERRATLLIWIGWVLVATCSVAAFVWAYVGDYIHTAMFAVAATIIGCNLRQNYLSRASLRRTRAHNDG